MFLRNEKGQKEFSGGQQDFDLAAKAANQCKNFKEDVEEELIVEDEKSCYNCRLRRWTSKTFVCCSSAV
ncbi:hypothetical protein CACET_c08770 [Clostridium aceticum]|uniref:Uncharacterized protein n=1 Tax=Clostridium aceticum TaxID=84022 RepID=A0A0D8IEJ3_9CLOT|nr:hypothetical protein [Clostridium aceticum]AKL94385.1 hypothetical protein CACET_c08770 [Clostridium aceticum]KJF28387.1 hypothetical protein TZ02_03210 [Clostridium aceticum]